MADTLAASVIITSFNRRADLAECLRALPESSLDAHNAEVIVFDDASTDGTAEFVSADSPHVILLGSTVNCGPSHARNAASRLARGRLLLFVDSDAVPSPEWLPRMLESDDGNTILIGAVRDYIGGRLQSGPRRATFIGKSLPCHPSRANTGASCNLGVPKACFDALGGFDEELPYYFEDSDLCIRARKAGYKATYLIDAEVRHKGNETKRGPAIRMQEENSTYAMLKAYRGKPLHQLAFTAANSAWAAARVASYSLRGNFTDARAIASGSLSAHRRYIAKSRTR